MIARKITNEEMEKAAEILLEGCGQHSQRCEGCPFAVDDDDFIYCKLAGSHPLSWEYFPEEKTPEKTPKKKIVPFDFSLKEDRDALMGKRIISTSGDLIVTAFAFWSDRGWLLQVDSEFGYDSDFVLGEFVFADTGKPVGKEVEDGD